MCPIALEVVVFNRFWLEDTENILNGGPTLLIVKLTYMLCIKYLNLHFLVNFCMLFRNIPQISKGTVQVKTSNAT